MTTREERKVIANALEVYIQTLRGVDKEEAMRRRPYAQGRDEQSIAELLSTDKKVCEQGKEAKQ